tara:strand:+ start:197 stop:502 length:306 start_codon:yes stop_codon:yes gene_type:complete
MIIYNVTVNIENDVHDDWFNYMKTTHIPEVMQTGFFLEHKICKVLSTQEDETGHTYAIQYTCARMEDLEEYQANYAAELQKDHMSRFEGKFVSFRTLLEVV